MTSFFDTTSRSIFGARAPKTPRQDTQMLAIARGDIALMARLVHEANRQPDLRPAR